jgi:hypothetical protein
MQAAFLEIRPFPHGNGRLIRLVSGLIVQAAGLPLPPHALTTPDHWAAYEAAVRAAVAGHPAALERLLQETASRGGG